MTAQAFLRQQQLMDSRRRAAAAHLTPMQKLLPEPFPFLIRFQAPPLDDNFSGDRIHQYRLYRCGATLSIYTNSTVHG